MAERHASCVLRDLAWALADLVSVPRGKRIVRFYEDAWELCVERLAQTATLSVYRGGAEPTVLVYDRAVVFEEMCASVVDAIDATIPRHAASSPRALELGEVRRVLEAARAEAPAFEDEVPASSSVAVDIDRDAPISFAAEFSMRPGPSVIGTHERSVERADLHALLVRGRMRAEIRGRSVDVGEMYPFLFAERMLDLARRALDAWERGQPFFARVDAGGAMIGLRCALAADVPPAALTISPGSMSENARGMRRDRTVSTFPELSLFDVVEAALAFGRALVRALVRRDRTQGGNLRLAAFRRDVRAVSDSLREVRRQDARINPAPESYRAFAHQVRAKQESNGLSSERAKSGQPSPTRLRYTARWRALVPGIDLRATFLCGDRLVVGGAQETFCLDRTSGEVHWRVPTRARRRVPRRTASRASRATASSRVLDFFTGEVRARAKLRRRTSGPSRGRGRRRRRVCPSSSSSPRASSHLVAVDLLTGEARWRTPWGNGSVLRMKRARKAPLLYERRHARSPRSTCRPARSCGACAIACVSAARRKRRHDVIFAVAGGVSGAGSLYAIDAFEGAVKFVAPLPGPDQRGDLHVRAGTLSTVEGSPLICAHTVVVAVRDREGVRLAAFDRATGEPALDVAVDGRAEWTRRGSRSTT